jgi:hypothetical protein
MWSSDPVDWVNTRMLRSYVGTADSYVSGLCRVADRILAYATARVGTTTFQSRRPAATGSGEAVHEL